MQPDKEDLGKLSVGEIKKRFFWAGATVPIGCVEKTELVLALKKVLADKLEFHASKVGGRTVATPCQSGTSSGIASNRRKNIATVTRIVQARAPAVERSETNVKQEVDGHHSIAPQEKIKEKRKLKVNTSAPADPDFIRPDDIPQPRKRLAMENDLKRLAISMALEWLWEAEFRALGTPSEISWKKDCASAIAMGTAFLAHRYFSGAQLSLGPIVEAFQDLAPHKRWSALDLLERTKAAAVPYTSHVVELLTDSAVCVRLKALQVLSGFKDNSGETLDAMIRLLDDPQWNWKAREALCKLKRNGAPNIGNAHAKAVAGRLNSHCPKVRRAAVEVLASFNQLAQPYVRQIFALQPFDGAPEALEQLRRHGVYIEVSGQNSTRVRQERKSIFNKTSSARQS